MTQALKGRPNRAPMDRPFKSWPSFSTHTQGVALGWDISGPLALARQMTTNEHLPPARALSEVPPFMRWNLLLVLSACCVALFSAGCGGQAPSSSAHPTNEVYLARGVLKELKPDGKTAVIRHEEIPNYMDAMTMDFEVKDKRELAGLKPGDALSFRLLVTTNDAWIDQVRKLAPQNTTNQPNEVVLNTGTGTNAAPAKFRKSPVVEPLEVGQQVPDYQFTNHLGQPVSFGQLKGKAFAITFVFTRCPLPTYCPRMNGNFASAQNKLAALAHAPTNWILFSISFDPEWDTPERMAKYARPYGVDPRHWQFVVSDFWNIDGLTEQLGVQFWKQDGSINHNLRTAVFDTRGRLQKVLIGNEWGVDEFVEELVKATRVQ